MLGAGSLIEMMISIVSHISSKRCRLLLDVRTSYVARCALSSSCTYVYVYLSMVDTSLPLSHACSQGSLVREGIIGHARRNYYFVHERDLDSFFPSLDFFLFFP